MRGEANGHFLAEAGAAAGHQNPLSLENIAAEHEGSVLVLDGYHG
jgi:hypothetical protein